jgi:hypothetical protein
MFRFQFLFYTKEEITDLNFEVSDEWKEHKHTHTRDNTYHGGYWPSKKNQIVRSVLQNDQHHYSPRNLI